MIIKKKRNEYDSYNIEITLDDKVLVILQTGDDYTWYVRYKDYSSVSEMEICIPKSEEVYPLFERLYERIVSGNLMDWDVNRPDTKDKIDMEKCTTWYRNTVRNGVITVLSDAYPISCPNILTIKKVDDAIILEFVKVENEIREPKSKFNITINIRQSGSRLYEISYPFKQIFRELQLINVFDVKEKKLGTNPQ